LMQNENKHEYHQKVKSSHQSAHLILINVS